MYYIHFIALLFTLGAIACLAFAGRDHSETAILKIRGAGCCLAIALLLVLLAYFLTESAAPNAGPPCMACW